MSSAYYWLIILVLLVLLLLVGGREKLPTFRRSRSQAQEWYKLLHGPMCEGMQLEEFEKIMGPDHSQTFIEIKQIYNSKRDEGEDPAEAVTAEDYQKLLSEL